MTLVIKKIEAWNRKVSRIFEYVALVAMLFIMTLTCVDVVGAKVFLHPIFGALDLVMLAQIVVVSFAATSTMMVGRHVKVDFFISLFPPRLKHAAEVFTNLLGLVLFAIIVWRLTLYAVDVLKMNESSLTARIPLYPFAFGAALGCLPVCIQYFLQTIKKIAGIEDV